MYGTRAFGKHGAILKPSSLYTEIVMRVEIKVIMAEYFPLKSMGMLRWPTYKEQRDNINRLAHIINRSVEACKRRRLEAGLFYLTRPPNDVDDIMICSPLYRMPLNKALKKCRQNIKNRKEILASYKASQTTTSEKACMKRLLSYTIVSIFIGCIIVLIP